MIKSQLSTKKVDENLLEEVKAAIAHIKWGSIEIFIQDSMVVQITERNIKKMQGSGKK